MYSRARRDCSYLYRHTYKKSSFRWFFMCAPTTPQLEHLFKSILYMYSRLKELGFVYSNGLVSILETEEDAHE